MASGVLHEFYVEDLMRRWFYPSILTVLTLSAAATQAKDFQVEPRTEAAVREASDDWLAAERRGDVAALDRRLMPEYRLSAQQERDPQREGGFLFPKE